MAHLLLGAFLLLSAPGPALPTSTNFTTARDYVVTSENYPGAYPRGERWVWMWGPGVWGVYCPDFRLACSDSTLTSDTLVIRDGSTNLHYICDTRPPVRLFDGGFQLELVAHPRGHDEQARGFKCHVFHGDNKGEVESKVNDLKARQGQGTEDDTDGDGDSALVKILVIVVVNLVVLVIAVVVCLLVRRRQQQTNTSVQLNIGDIRRGSSVCYTRHGNGDPPRRPRLDSEDSLFSSPHTGERSTRPLTRKGSNASWAMRAEMSGSVRPGGRGEGAQGEDAEGKLNLYSPFPSKGQGLREVTRKQGHVTGSGGLWHTETSGAFLACRLSTIVEEAGPGRRKASLGDPGHGTTGPETDLDSGYLLMAGGTAYNTDFSANFNTDFSTHYASDSHGDYANWGCVSVDLHT